MERGDSGEPEFHALTHLLPDTVRQALGTIWGTFCLAGERTVVFFSHTFILTHHIDKGTFQPLRVAERRFTRAFKHPHRPVVWLLDEKRQLWEFNIRQNSLALLYRNIPPTIAILPHQQGYLLICRDGRLLLMPHSPTGTPTLKVWAPHLHALLREAVPYCASKILGGYLIGTENNGAIHIDESGHLVEIINRKAGIPNQTIWHIAYADTLHTALLATDNGFALVSLPVSVRLFREGIHYEGPVTSILPVYPPEVDGRMVFFTTLRQAYYIRNNEIHPIPGTQGQNWALALSPDNQSILIASGKKGLLQWDISKNKLIQITSEPVYLLAKADSLLLTASVSQLCLHTFRAEGKAIVRHTCVTLVDLPNAIALLKEGNHYYAIAEQPQSSIAVSRIHISERGVHLSKPTYYDTTFTGLPPTGLNFFTADSHLLIGSERGLASLHISGGKPVVKPFCNYGRIFCDGSRQVFRLTKVHNTVFLNALHRGHELTYMITLDSTGTKPVAIDSSFYRAVDIGGVYALAGDPLQHAWIGGVFGIAHFDPGALEDFRRPFRCLIKKIVLRVPARDDTTSRDSILWDWYTSTGPFAVLPAHSQLTISWVAPYYFHQERVVYRHWLEGFDQGWSDWSPATTKEYTGLPPGEYTLHIQAKNVYGVLSQPATWHFKILPPWYMTWWAYLLYGMGFAATVSGASLAYGRWRTYRLRKERERLQQLVDERTRELQQAYLRLSEAHKNIQASLAYGALVQKSFLPSPQQMQEALGDYLLIYMPHSQVSGDFYWVHHWYDHHGKKTLLLVGDCTGHGVPGALLTITMLNLLEEIVRVNHTLQPHLILSALQQEFVTRLSGEHSLEDGMEAAICLIDWHLKQIAYSGAGMPAYLCGEAQILEGSATPHHFLLLELNPAPQHIGYRSTHTPFALTQVRLLSSTTLYLVSDGYPDQLGGLQYKKFGRKRLRELLTSISRLPLEAQKQRLLEEHHKWKGSREQTDDITILAVKL